MPSHASTHASAAILAIGDELVLGQSLDTNTRWLAARLVARGIRIAEHITVADDAVAITAALLRLASGADLVIATGGLGPTADDLTRRALADALGDPLIEDPAALEMLAARAREKGLDLTPERRSQALRPASARCLPNQRGTAPGLAAVIGGAEVYCIPGPPYEMTHVFEAAIEPLLRVPAGRVVAARTLRVFGIAEADAAGLLGDLMQRDRNPTIGTTVSGGIISVRLRYEGDASGADAALGADAAEVAARLAPHHFGADEDTLASACIAGLAERGDRLVTAESCTGGGIAAMLTDVPGSSAVVEGGWVTYSNEHKRAQLGVPGDLLETVGAVSREVAGAMAIGALAAGAEASGPARRWAIAVTGIAGPGGGTAGKPVGTVWIAIASTDGTADVRRFVFPGDRGRVRDLTAKTALMQLLLALRGEAATPLLFEEPG